MRFIILLFLLSSCLSVHPTEYLCVISNVHESKLFAGAYDFTCNDTNMRTDKNTDSKIIDKLLKYGKEHKTARVIYKERLDEYDLTSIIIGIEDGYKN